MKRKFLLVGLTGGIATGKSTVSRIFRDLGCLIIDADLQAREVMEPGPLSMIRLSYDQQKWSKDQYKRSSDQESGLSGRPADG